MTLTELAPEALNLTERERIILASSLWQSIEDPYDLKAHRGESEAIELALKRDHEIESGQTQALTHQELFSRL